MTPEEREAHIRHLADSHCKANHPDYYGPPCDGCIKETRKRLEDKRAKVHGRLLSPEEAAELRRELGLEE